MRVSLCQRASIARYPKAFWYLLIGMLVNGTATFVLPFEALYLVAVRHFPVSQASAIIGIYGIGSCVAALVGGVLADKMGRRPTILIGLLCLAATTFGLAFISDTWPITVLTFTMGFWISWYRPASNAVVADIVPREAQAHANGLVYWAYNLGMAISPLLASVIVQHIGYTLLFCIDGCGTTLFWALMFIGLPETRPDRAPSRGHNQRTPALYTKRGWRDVPFLCFVILSFALTSVYFQSSSTLPADMQLHGLDASQYGIAIAVNGVVVVLFGLLLPHLLSKGTPFRALAISALFLGAGFGLTALADSLVSLPAYMGSIAIWTLGEILFVPVSATVVAIFSPASLRGTYQGIARLFWGLSACAGPLVGGFILQRWSASLWIGCAALSTLVACGFLLIGQQSVQRQTSEKSQREPCEANTRANASLSQENACNLPLERRGEVDLSPVSVPSPEAEVYQATCFEASTGDVWADGKMRRKR